MPGICRPTQAPPVDVHYQSARDCKRRDAAVRHAYPKGHSRILEPHVAVGGALYASLLSHGACGSGPPAADVQGAVLDANKIDMYPYP